MTAFPSAIAIGDSLLAARKMMLELKVRHLPVMRDRDLVGVISDRDIKLVLGPEFDYPDPRDLTVEDAYVDHAYHVDIDTPLGDVARYMAEHHIGAAIVTKSGHLAGIFTATDACRALADLLQRDEPPDLVA